MPTALADTISSSEYSHWSHESKCRKRINKKKDLEDNIQRLQKVHKAKKNEFITWTTRK